jgi:hypothetical protein
MVPAMILPGALDIGRDWLMVVELVSVEEDWSALKKSTGIEEGPFEGPSSQFLCKAIGEAHFQSHCSGKAEE